MNLLSTGRNTAMITAFVMGAVTMCVPGCEAVCKDWEHNNPGTNNVSWDQDLENAGEKYMEAYEFWSENAADKTKLELGVAAVFLGVGGVLAYKNPGITR